MKVDLVEMTGTRILVADDSPVYRHLIKQVLSNHRYPLIFASNGDEAWKLFEEHRPEIVITDWNMPGCEGPELCRRIRNLPCKSYNYIIIVSSQSNKKNVIEGLKAGADDYLTKPFDEGELLARIAVGQRIVTLHRQIEEKNARLAELALTDQLTGLPNRRALEKWALREMSAAERHRYAIWVAMADLDHFKDINDAFGHNIGDTVLQGFADILRRNTRQSDISARFGGEEFLMLLTHADLNRTTTAVERIRWEFESRKFMTTSGTVSATVSFGIAGFEGGQPIQFEELVAKADRALYRAKEAGRNRIMHS